MNFEHIQRLIRDKAFPDNPAKVILKDTHISWVCITDKFAYKIKKPVAYSFLDFSTLEKRKFYCQEELRLNSRLAPEMYQEVLPVKKGAGEELGVGAKTGQIIDYALKMKRMDFSSQLDLLLEDGQVEKSSMSDIAAQLTVFHKKVEKVHFTDDAILDIHDKFADILSVKEVIHDICGPEAVNLLDEITAFSHQFIKENFQRFRQRADDGFMVDGHGDLHSGNIFLSSPPVIFDCIEFNEAFRRVDVLNDIAFLCMDLEFFNRKDLSDFFLAQYLKHHKVISNSTDEAIFDYYKMYRANVRLKVSALKVRQLEKESEEFASLLSKINTYLQLLNMYLKVLV